MGNLLSKNSNIIESTPTPTQKSIPTQEFISTSTSPLMNQQLAQNIINLQNIIIKTAQENINAIKQINLSNSNIEEFTIQQKSPDLYFSPIYIPTNGSPELDDYTTAYNNSIALLDDPRHMSQANFDAYIHMQDNKIAQLQSQISSFSTNTTPQKNPIRSIKNLKTSVGLNLEPYHDPAIQNNLSNTYAGNGAPTYPNYLIYANNGCLQYIPHDTNNNLPASWSIRPCNSNLAGQRFNMQQINNIDKYNLLITDPNNASYKITDPNSAIFGFYVVNPEGYNEQCLQINNDGLSVMPCNMDSTQRFKPYYHTIKP